jgi:hypothetical protein
MKTLQKEMSRYRLPFINTSGIAICGRIVDDKHTWIMDFCWGTSGQTRMASAGKADKDISFVSDHWQYTDKTKQIVREDLRRHNRPDDELQ